MEYLHLNKHGGKEKLEEIVKVWLTTPFYTGPNYQERYLNRFLKTVELERKALIEALPWWFRPLGHLFIR